MMPSEYVLSAIDLTNRANSATGRRLRNPAAPRINIRGMRRLAKARARRWEVTRAAVEAARRRG